MRGRVLRKVLAVTVAVAALTGCTGRVGTFEGVASLPLPGGVSTGSDSYTITVKFSDVTNLVPHAAVKLNNVTVGTVTEIELEGWHAKVTCELKGKVDLPDNAVAKVAQTSLLGTKFVRLAPPSSVQPRGGLSGGDVIPLARTGRYPEVEEVLSALSLLLNGGGLKQIKTITEELNAVLDGREARIKDLLHRLDTFVSALEEQKSEIVRALEGIERLSATLKEQKRTIADAVDRIEPALEVLNKQQDRLTKTLVALSDLGDVATEVIKKSRKDLLANLRNLEPILAKLADAGAALPKALELIATFPFPRTTKKAIAGDYVNLKVTVDVDLRTILNNLLGGVPYAQDTPPVARPPGQRGGNNGGGKDAGSPATPSSSGSGQTRSPLSPPSPSLPGNTGGNGGTEQPADPGGDSGGEGLRPPQPGGESEGRPSQQDGQGGQQDDLLDLLLGGGS